VVKRRTLTTREGTRGRAAAVLSYPAAFYNAGINTWRQAARPTSCQKVSPNVPAKCAPVEVILWVGGAVLLTIGLKALHLPRFGHARKAATTTNELRASSLFLSTRCWPRISGKPCKPRSACSSSSHPTGEESLKKIHGELLAFLPSWELVPLLDFKASSFHVPTLGVELVTSHLGAQRSPPLSQGGIREE